MAKIKLTEGKLRQMISEAVKRALNEEMDFDNGEEYGSGLAFEEPKEPNYGVTFVRGDVEEVTAMIQECGRLEPSEDTMSYYGNGVIIMAGPGYNKMNSYGDTKVIIDIDKLLSSSVKVKKIDDFNYMRKNNGKWQCLAKYVPADCIVDIQ